MKAGDLVTLKNEALAVEMAVGLIIEVYKSPRLERESTKICQVIWTESGQDQYFDARELMLVNETR